MAGDLSCFLFFSRYEKEIVYIAVVVVPVVIMLDLNWSLLTMIMDSRIVYIC
jgi:hypothetical protein